MAKSRKSYVIERRIVRGPSTDVHYATGPVAAMDWSPERAKARPFSFTEAAEALRILRARYQLHYNVLFKKIEH